MIVLSIFGIIFVPFFCLNLAFYGHKGVKRYVFCSILMVNRTCEYLVRTHMERNDKIIIFGDNVFSLKKVLTLEKVLYLCHLFNLTRQPCEPSCITRLEMCIPSKSCASHFLFQSVGWLTPLSACSMRLFWEFRTSMVPPLRANDLGFWGRFE